MPTSPIRTILATTAALWFGQNSLEGAKRFILPLQSGPRPVGLRAADRLAWCDEANESGRHAQRERLLAQTEA